MCPRTTIEPGCVFSFSEIFPTSAITFASQIAKVESLPNPNDFGTLVRGLNVYGYKVVKPEALAMALVGHPSSGSTA